MNADKIEVNDYNGSEILQYQKMIIEMIPYIKNINHLTSIYSFVKVKYDKTIQTKKEIS